MEITRAAAEKALKDHGGDLKEALETLTAPVITVSKRS